MAAGEAASQITMDMTGNRILSMAAGMLGSGVTAHGLSKFDKKSFKSIGTLEYNKGERNAAVKADIELSENTVKASAVDAAENKKVYSQFGDVEGGRGEEYSRFLKDGSKEKFTPVELEGIKKAENAELGIKIQYCVS